MGKIMKALREHVALVVLVAVVYAWIGVLLWCITWLVINFWVARWAVVVLLAAGFALMLTPDDKT
jgi:hypothetical protein